MSDQVLLAIVAAASAVILAIIQIVAHEFAEDDRAPRVSAAPRETSQT